MWIANKISAVGWPQRLHVHVLGESMTSFSSVWNAMLACGTTSRRSAAWEPPDVSLGTSGFPIRVADLRAEAGEPAPGPTDAARAVRQAGKPVMRVSHHALDAARAREALAEMLALDGLLGCAVVDGTTGLVLAREAREDQPADLDLSAAASAQVLRAHRMVARSMGLNTRSTRSW